MGIWDKFYERAKSFFAEGNNAEPKSRCYYDLLEVSRDATEDEIKRSFKRLALKWHPDKNPERSEECTAYFVLIQQAYEVLIDPQERAFYDRHRENIIYQQRDEGPSAELRDLGINLDPYMSTACFRGSLFADLNEEQRDENFYAVYRDLFHKLAAEEYAYIEEPEERNFPVFGKTNSDYDTVVAPFYSFWLDFFTQRSFAWLDKWDLRQAQDRQTTRAMEKENKKLRELGRKQRSEEVRRLVEFVRKHDKRVEQAKERQRERNVKIQQIVEEQRRQTIRRNLETLDTFEIDEEAHQQHLAHLKEIERALDAEFGTVETAEESSAHGSAHEDDNEDNGQLRCIICEKAFKSKQVLVNHQRSKKHRQMAELLRIHMRKEDQKLFEGEGEDEGGGGSVKGEDEEQPQRSGKKRKRKRAKKAVEQATKTEGEEQKRNELEKEEAVATAAEEESGQKESDNGRKSEKMAASKTANQRNNKQKGRKDKSEQQKGNTDDHEHYAKRPVPSECLMCGAEFESKTKLHAHLRESGHATIKTTLVPPNQMLAGTGKRKGGKKGVK